jgi:hypothetical protein
MHPKYWKFPGGRRFMDQANDGTGGSSGGSGGAEPTAEEKAAAEKAAADKAAADKAAAEEAARKGNQPTDAEAKLLKEVMQKKEALKKAEEDAAAAKARLAEFDGVDPAEIRKLIAERKSAEEAQLAAKGDFETLKARMAEEHTKAMSTIQTEKQTLAEQLAAAQRQIEELAIGSQFAQSKFIGEELTLTPTKARTIYGAHFDTVDGQVVAYDKPRGAAGRTPLVDQFGNNVGFEDALRKIIDADPDKDSLLRSKMKAGAGSISQRTAQPATQAKPTDPASKIAAGLANLNLLAQKPM